MVNKFCEECGAGFQVIKSRMKTAKFCSTQCRDKGLIKEPNQKCDVCGTAFHRKQSQINRYARNLGMFCSHACAGKAKSDAYLGEKNPNHKGRNVDQDGYRLFVPVASQMHGLKRMKLHQAVCCELLGIQQMPKSVHVHHRDCDIQNNDPVNLAVLNLSDHRWLHKQFGSATLWAYCHEKLFIEDMLTWCDDKERAKRLLPLNILIQAKQIPIKELS